MELVEIGFGNFRSIGETPVFINLRKKANILIGANNCGKSNVLRALQWLSSSVDFTRGRGRKIELIDRHNLSEGSGLRVLLRARVSPDDLLSLPGETVQFGYRLTGGRLTCDETWFGDKFNVPRLTDVRRKLGMQQSMNYRDQATLQRAKREIASLYLQPLLKQLPKVHLVPQFRQIQSGGEYAFSGTGAIKRLAEWQHPNVGKDADADRKRFDAVQGLLQRLLRMPDAQIEVPASGDEIIVARDELRLPLASYGTGVHELIIMAIALHSEKKAIFCIEEPEIHLHPALQREFLRFLISETENRYVITTHSNAFLDLSDAVQITHLRSVEEATVSAPVETPAGALALLADLGVRASDLLQANCVIWVEGPSDRIYLKRWISCLDADLQEGVHYSIMFYGGKLLSHLELQPDAAAMADDLISLLRINQHSIVLMDSDKHSANKRINRTKQRIRSECKHCGVLCWVTWGREIENYLPPEAVAKAYADKIGPLQSTLSLDRFDRLEDRLKKAYGPKWKKAWSYDAAKPAWARRIVEHLVPDTMSRDLRKELGEVIAGIRAANGVSSS